MYELVVLTMVEEGLILRSESSTLGDSRPLKAPLRPLPSGEVSLLVFPHTHFRPSGCSGASSFRRLSRLAFSRSKASRAGWRYQCPVAHLSRQHL